MRKYPSRWLLVLALEAFGCGGEGAGSAPSSGEAGAPSSVGGDGGDSSAGSSGAGEAGAGGSAGGEAGAGGASDVPSTVTGGAECIISADCSEGTHCDLGECVQDCSDSVPCKKGLACSPRGRCIASPASDVDPPPVTSQAGTVTVSPAAAELAESDTTFEVSLSSTSNGPVDYRIDLRAPFLTLSGSARGSFKGQTTIPFRVKTAGLSGTVTSGTILFHTSLGDAVVSPSIRVGLSGTYQGVMRYSSGSTAFGDVGIGVMLLDDHGDVSMGIDPAHSMTFPRMSSGVAAGHGTFTFSDGLNVTVTQRIDAAYGGTRNHFQRPLGRQVRFSLKPTPDAGGRLEGTFEETVYGLLGQPIVLHGTTYLEPRETDYSLDFKVPEPITPISGTSAFASISVFPGWSDLSDPQNPIFGDCANDGDVYADCPTGDLECISGPGGIEEFYYESLNGALGATRATATPVDDIADICRRELGQTTAAAFRAQAKKDAKFGGICAYIPPLACALRDIAQTTWNTAANLKAAQTAYNRLFARALAPALLVAQSDIVLGLKASFESGANAEATRFASARDVLHAPLSFVLSSGALQFLETVPVKIAAGDKASTDSTATNYPAARALARALYVLHTVDGEEAARDAADLTTSQTKKLEQAQARGVLGLLEAIALSSVMDTWGNPPNLGNEFVGSLTLADRGFQALQHGALAFGIPEGEVPIAFDPSISPNTNFGQILDIHAKTSLDIAASDETAFTGSEREFEQNATSLEAELEGVRLKYGEQIRDICGSGFSVDDVHADADWANCGADGTGQLAELGLDIAQANLRLQASYARLDGMRQKIAIDQKRLADTQNVREATIQFSYDVGKQLTALVIAEGFVNIMEKTIEIASQANLWNGGAPLGEAFVMGVLEAERTAIQTSRQELQNAQQMRALTDEKQVELINGMSDLQKQTIDMAQLRIEMQQDTLAVTQADLRRRDLLEKAKRSFLEHTRSLARISDSALTDPMYRVLESRLALMAVHSRAVAQTWLYRAGRALEYELNRPFGDALGRAVLGAYNTNEAARLANCMRSIHSAYSTTFGIPQEYSTTFSVRQMLGVTGPRTDEVTGEELSEGELFRRAVLKNENFDRQGNLSITFATNLQPGNPLWATNLCNDKVDTVQAQLVGDFQGNNQAQILLGLDGGALLRSCDSEELTNWILDGSAVPIDVGVNSFGEAKPNSYLYGQAVARASWTITIPPGNKAPSNADLHLDHLEDIVIRVTHKALPQKGRATPIDTSCLGTVGAG